VQVTGSRIVRRDFVANSPLVTVDSTVLESKSGLNIESYLNQLPAFNPAASPTVKGGSGGNTDVQISAVNSVGIASISLRGFGPNRSLALIDGRRAVPTNALMVVDINGIPSSMIGRAEIISGGASATYGADAIGGVSNFILRRNFQGLEADLQYGTTAAGDGDELRASTLFGTKFADNRGNITFASEYYKREAAYEKNRDFYTNSWKDPTVGGNFLGFVFGANGINSTINPGNAATLGAILSGRPKNAAGAYTTGVYPFPGSGVFAGLRFNSDGTIFDPAGNNAWSFKRPIDNYQYSLVNAYDNTFCNSAARNAAGVLSCLPGPTGLIQQVKYNEVEGYASSPQTRYAFMATANYEINDSVEFFSSARFAQSLTRTFLAGTNASYGWEVTVPYNATVDSPVDPSLNYRDPAVVAAVMANPGAFANPGFIAHGAAGAQHPVPLQMAMLLNSRAINPLGAGWVMETFPLDSFGRRATENTINSWQVETGVKFDLPVKDWTGEVYYSRGESSTYNVAFGNNSLARWRAMVTAPDYGRNASLQSNLTNNGPGANPGFGSVPVKCTSGFYENIFNGDARPSDDCRYAVEAPLQTRTQNQQDIAELNLQGGLFDLPGGEVRAAAGYQFRRNSAQFNPDILQSTASFTDQVIGVYPTGYLDKQTTVKDFYAELLLPVLGENALVRKVELELGGRVSDYDTADSTTTFKVNANVQVNDSLRFRGGFNRANRAPNLGELYLNLQQIFTSGGTYGDPCGLRSTAPFGAGGATADLFPGAAPSLLANGQTAAGAQSAYLICRAMMGTVGANYFYGGAAAQPGSGGGGFAWVNQVGNPNLNSEIADTWTAGIVFASPFEHDLLRNITATVDWYQIGIKDAILPYSIDYARWRCFGAVQVTDAAGAAAQAASQACLNVPRSQTTGGALNTLVSYDNQARVRTTGIDFTLNWTAQLADMGMEGVPGSLGINVQGTVLDEYKTKQSPANYDPVIDWKGSLGPNLQGFNAGAYDYRVFTSISYNLPNFGVSLRWRHLPSVAVAGQAQQDAIVKNNAAVKAGAPGAILSYTPITNVKAPSYDVLDLSAYWTINDMLSMRFGVDNVLDKDPARTGIANGYPYNPSLTPAQNADAMAAVCGGAPGCVNPTAYSLPNSGAGSTSGGYYDVLGRRYFVGLKARF